MSVYLKDLYLGNSDGDSESKNSQFSYLFYKDHQFEFITKDPLKFIISGQKGTGKTIMGRYIEQTCYEQGFICKLINKHDLSLAKFIEVGHDYFNEDELVIFLKWFVLKEYAKLILANQMKYRWRGELNLRQYLNYRQSYNKLHELMNGRYKKGNFENQDYNVEDFGSSDFQMTMTQFKALKSRSQKTGATYKQKPYYKLVDEIGSYILDILKFQNVVVILDDLDEMNLNLTKSSGNIQPLIALINAVKEINDEFYNESMNQSKCILLIRNDLLRGLHIHCSNLNKIVSDCSVELYWMDRRTKQPETHRMMSMILNKIKYTCDEYSELSDKELYTKLFPKHVSGKTVIQYLLDHSFGRPRDVVNYLNIIKEHYPMATSFLPSMFNDCKGAYSERLLNELANELSLHMSSEYFHDLMNLLYSFQHATFLYHELETYFEVFKADFPHITDLSKAVADCYQYGIIGNSYEYVTPSKKTKIKYTWAYTLNGAVTPDYTKRFSVHFGLRKGLGL